MEEKYNYKAINSDWITKGIDDATISYLEKVVLFLCDKKPTDEKAGFAGITMTQLRNIFGEIKKIENKIIALENGNTDESEWITSFQLLKPKVLYNVARAKQNARKETGTRMVEFGEIFSIAHGFVGKNKDNFKRFSKFFEGIVAYHKVYGGKDQ